MEIPPAAPPVRLRPEIVGLPAYRQGKQADADAFKLSSNENPFEPHPAVLEALRDAENVNRYPDAGATTLREALAARHARPLDEVHVAAGSVSIIAQLLLAAAGPGSEVVYPWRSFEAYPGLVTVSGAHGIPVPNLPDHRHDMVGLAAAVTERTRVLLVCSPNNPTGPIVRREEFDALMESVPADLLVVLDEAYAEFVDDPDAVDGVLALERYPNLVVLRTFSKAYGLAGLRVGYALGPAVVLDAARSTAIPLAVTGHAQAAALAALEHEAELLDRVAVLRERRDALWRALTDLGWAIPRPQGNFIWLPTGEATDEAAAVLARHGLVVRAFPPDGIRVSVGEHASVDKLLAAATEIVRSLLPGAGERG